MRRMILCMLIMVLTSVLLLAVPHKGSIKMTGEGQRCLDASKTSTITWDISEKETVKNGSLWTATGKASIKIDPPLAGGDPDVNASAGQYEITFDKTVDYTIIVTITYSADDDVTPNHAKLPDSVESATFHVSFRKIAVNLESYDDTAIGCDVRFTANSTCGIEPYTHNWFVSAGSGSHSSGTIKARTFVATLLGNQWVKVIVTDSMGNTGECTKTIIVHEELELSNAQTTQEYKPDKYLVTFWINRGSGDLDINVSTKTSVNQKTGVTVSGEIPISKILLKLGASTEIEIKNEYEKASSYKLGGNKRLNLYAIPFVNVIKGDGKQWNCDGTNNTGKYENRTGPSLGWDFEEINL